MLLPSLIPIPLPLIPNPPPRHKRPLFGPLCRGAPMLLLHGLQKREEPKRHRRALFVRVDCEVREPPLSVFDNRHDEPEARAVDGVFGVGRAGAAHAEHGAAGVHDVEFPVGLAGLGGSRVLGSQEGLAFVVRGQVLRGRARVRGERARGAEEVEDRRQNLERLDWRLDVDDGQFRVGEH